MGDTNGSPLNNNPYDDVREELNEAMPRVSRAAIIQETLRLHGRSVAAQGVVFTGVAVTGIDRVGAGVPEIPRPAEGSPVRAAEVHILNQNPLINNHSNMMHDLGVIRKSRSVNMYNGAGEVTAFGDLLDELRTPTTNKIMAIFIRHFFCGHCQEYVRALSAAFPNPNQDLPTGCKMVIIGCGAHTLIDQYRAATRCPFAIYSDQTTELFRIFAMRRNLLVGKDAPSFSPRSDFSLMLSGIKQGLKRLFKGDAFKAGSPRQNGGELLFEFEREPPLKTSGILAIRVTWCHIMETTRDHAPINVIKKVLGIPLPGETDLTQPAALAAAPLGSLL
ncbi:hypothetical protein H112_00704 [Trichophyton rubrum D6]|uniref:Uncharacterized protein n=3 Tax=Trichophyton rubrum TaxID=5551 RepID=A0A178F488_TRIRU|nr:uncharacterized protein TERG_07821 [Trichophyton rubrum CBS 118892]EZF27280.1 hypothetical protein H100_00704 [Trichophyton rubrum MR850]EZF46343.1 hypothetical protein H102_00694 [Trichophyton rubrum CBS 100081]EZF56967.1 hypothetical protein H103_00702 [Trichophyton rubrum CBS 288.86]EZF67596.1 hypothetical protein H104_00689 [Trichophyton rubrum CBS 289.86]EZF88887.1 hypothetical protein H110_00705 [Trichophyton rubrum MR1448]EZF99715.1 hypothetical protein H113_00704 [Trichophyton rubr